MLHPSLVIKNAILLLLCTSLLEMKEKWWIFVALYMISTAAAIRDFLEGSEFRISIFVFTTTVILLLYLIVSVVYICAALLSLSEIRTDILSSNFNARVWSRKISSR